MVIAHQFQNNGNKPVFQPCMFIACSADNTPTSKKLPRCVGTVFYSPLVGDIFDDIRHFAAQGFTQPVDRFRADVLAVLHPVQRVCRDPFFENQAVFGHIFAKQRIIKRFIANHLPILYPVRI